MKKIIEIGDGITARRGVEYSGSEDILEGMKEHAERVRRRQAEAGGVYAGYVHGLIEQWRAERDAAGEGPHAVDSRGWYAVRIVAAHERVLSGLERLAGGLPGGRADPVFKLAESMLGGAFDCGRLAATAAVKFNHEPDALRGKKIKNSAAEGGRISSAATAAETGARDREIRRRAAEIKEKHGDLSARSIAAKIENEMKAGVGDPLSRERIRKVMIEKA